MMKKLVITAVFITSALLIWSFGILRLREQSACEADEVLACCSLYDEDVCYISTEKICLTEYNIKCVPRRNNYPVAKPKI